MTKSNIYLISYIVIISLIFGGCTDFNTPPSVNYVEQLFQSNYGQIEIIVNFLINSDYRNIYINNADSIMIADLSKVPIPDKGVVTAIKTLLGTGQYKHISKTDTIITFLQWSGIKDIGCGIVYTSDVTQLAKKHFLTKIVPMSEVGWFYYIDDYNSWMSGQRAILP